MNYLFILLGSFCSLLVVSGALNLVARSRESRGGNVLNPLREEVAHKQELITKIKALYSGMIDIGVLHDKIDEYRSIQESLKAERGRITITQAELETVDSRLRELEEIERELENSGIETKEELNILKKKEDELNNKNNELKEQLANFMEQIEKVTSEIEMSAQLKIEIEKIQPELTNTQNKIQQILVQIEHGNEQYSVLKRRYDALDIEYAQLYEKFSDASGRDE